MRQTPKYQRHAHRELSPRKIYDYTLNRFCLTDTTDRQRGFYGLRDGRITTFAVHRTPDPSLPDNAQLAVCEAYSQWSRRRVTLLGDACQAVSLLAEQGTSLAIAGAYVLGTQLASADSLDAALARYQQLWQPLITRSPGVGRNGSCHRHCCSCGCAGSS